MGDKFLEQVEYVRKNPLVFIILATGWAATFYMTYSLDRNKHDLELTAIVIDAKKKELQAQAALEAMKDIEVSKIRPFFNDIVDTYDTPAWVKVLDYATQNFEFVTTNLMYTEVYGTPIFSAGLSDTDLYKNVELTDIERANLLEYELNDRKAARIGSGKCLIVYEFAYPVGRKKDLPPAKYRFKKCMLKHGPNTYVLGYLLK